MWFKLIFITKKEPRGRCVKQKKAYQDAFWLQLKDHSKVAQARLSGESVSFKLGLYWVQ
jgi:hypothetical protein